jgi:hypothetical protein
VRSEERLKTQLKARRRIRRRERMKRETTDRDEFEMYTFVDGDRVHLFDY